MKEFLILISLLGCVLLLNSRETSENILNLMEIESITADEQTNSQNIHGKIKIDNNIYNTICNCKNGQDNMAEPSLALCDPSQLKIIQDKEGEGSTRDEVEKILGNPSDYQFVYVESTHFECLDGRISHGILGTPGGDAGEFILALQVYENILFDMGVKKGLSQDQVDAYLSLYLEQMKQDQFYMCIDDTALQHLEKDSEQEINIDELRNLQVSSQDEILEYLVKPENVGDSHLKKLLTNPEFYFMKEDAHIVKQFLQAFYKILWDQYNPLRTKLLLDNLVGIRNESAFVEVKSNEACQEANIAPLMRPRNGKQSVLINHIDAVSLRRAQLAHFFTQDVNQHQEPIDKKTMYDRMQKLGTSYLAVTGTYIAKNLPFYTVSPE